MSTKVQSLIKLLLVFVVSLLSFSVGTYVGFRFSENKQKLALLEPRKEDPNHSMAHEDSTEESKVAENSHTESSESKRDIASVVDERDESSLSEDLPFSDEEVAKLKDEFISDDLPTPSKTASQKIGHKTDQVPSKAPASVAPVKDSEKAPQLTPPPSEDRQAALPPKQSLPPKEQRARLPQSLPPHPSVEASGKFTVQVSSFADETEAKQKALNLKNQGYNAFYVPSEVKGKTWYRVSIGLFDSEREARSLRENFLKENPENAAFIQKVPAE